MFNYGTIDQKSRDDVYSYMRGDYLKISKFLKEVNWEEQFNFKTVEECNGERRSLD